MSSFSPPGTLIIGLDAAERRPGPAKGSDGYPPFNVERMIEPDPAGERFRITVAVAGFAPDELELRLEQGRLALRGRRAAEEERCFLHRGIAARAFQRVFMLADGTEVLGATLSNGLLVIDLVRQRPEERARRVDIAVRP